jgi:16S rRNA (cytosine967-C5)-methyltransferase
LAILTAVRDGATLQAARDQPLADLTERDRRLAYELSAGVLRSQGDLDRALGLSRTDPRLYDVLRLGLYQLRYLTRVPAHAAVSTSVELARQVAGEGGARYVNQALRKLTEARDQGPGARGEGSHPEWLLQRWTRQFGAADAKQLVDWNDTKPALTVQPAKWDTPTLRARLQAAGVGVEEAPFGVGLRIRRDVGSSPVPRPASLPGFTEGGFCVQNPAHALVARFAAIPHGEWVYDACAAPGGKAVALERGGARVVAGDARADRMGRLAETTRRCGVAIRLVCTDLVAAPFAPGSLAAVVVDAPCTATGTMARHPDARWRLSPGAIVRAAVRQRRLLAAAAALVRPGGVLVYATCSLELEENEDVVTDFLRQHPEFARASAPGAVDAALLTTAGDFRSFPPRDGIDGAYAARLVRAARGNR